MKQPQQAQERHGEKGEPAELDGAGELVIGRLEDLDVLRTDIDGERRAAGGVARCRHENLQPVGIRVHDGRRFRRILRGDRGEKVMVAVPGPRDRRVEALRSIG